MQLTRFSSELVPQTSSSPKHFPWTLHRLQRFCQELLSRNNASWVECYSHWIFLIDFELMTLACSSSKLRQLYFWGRCWGLDWKNLPLALLILFGEHILWTQLPSDRPLVLLCAWCLPIYCDLQFKSSEQNFNLKLKK